MITEIIAIGMLRETLEKIVNRLRLFLPFCNKRILFTFSDPLESFDVCLKIWNPLGYGFPSSSIQRANTTYYYDNATKSCKPFNALGCLGNANNFESKQLCEAVCSSK